MRSLYLGGLGIQNLTMLSWAMKMHWLWMQKTQQDSPIIDVVLNIPPEAQMMFRISTCFILSNGERALFWTNRWAHGKSLEEPMLTVMPQRGWRNRTIQQALTNNAWMQDIMGGLPVVAVEQVLHMMDIITNTVLTEQEDQLVWLASASGQFSTKTTYACFFISSTEFDPFGRLWKT